jgi:WD40 repeat protein/serine/threonine protein kinase
MNDHHDREAVLFSLARQLPAGERAAYLDGVCAGDATLRQQVEELLQAGEDAGDFLESPAPLGELMSPSRAAMKPGGGALGSLPNPIEKLGLKIGRYKLLQQLGEGGCGVVYMAEQEEPVRRRVALKVIKLGMDTKSVIARFEAERQALAVMDHPNIAKVLDGGATDSGRPYFVMELVRGLRITEFCDQNRLATRERLELFIQVCRAVQHAHQKGIIHRDLKPSNILVTVRDPGAPGVPMIIDFGIAKATQGRLSDQTFFTAFEQFLGTPAYMSPEQATMTALDIDTRSDIYSLGVLLYELLTGRTPFDQRELLAAGLEEMRRTIREREPLRPSTRLRTLLAAEQTTTASLRQAEPPRLVHLVRGDLDWIVMKCLEKDRARRYETANALAMDLQRHLRNEPVVACPPSRLYEFQKTVQRHWVAFAAAVVVAAVLVVGAAISTWQAVLANRARQAAVNSRILAEQAEAKEQQQRQLAEVRLYAADMAAAQQAFENGNLGRARDLLQAHWPRPGQRDLRGFEWRYLWNLCRGDNFHTFFGHSNTVRSVAFSPDGNLLASGSEESVRLWDIPNRRLVAAIPARVGRGPWLAFSNDGATLATAGEDGIQLWNTKTQQLLFTLPEKSVACIAFSPGGTWLAIGYGHPVFGDCYGGPMKLWDYVRHQVDKTFPEPGSRLAFSPDGKTLAARSGDDAVKLWDVETGQELRKLDHAWKVHCLSFSPDGQTVAAAGADGQVRRWSVATGDRLSPLQGHRGMMWSLAFSPDGKLLATGGSDQLHLWNVATGTEVRKLIGHGSEVKAVAFAPDGQTLATGGKDPTVMLWSTAPKRAELVITNVHHPPSFSRDSKLLATSQYGGPVTLRDAATRRAVWVLPSERRPRFSTEDKTLATLSTNRVLRFWDPASQSLLRSVPLPNINGSTQQWLMALRGHRLAAVDENGLLTLHDVTTGGVLGSFRAYSGDTTALAFSPDARLLATGGEDQPVKLWDVATQKELASGDKGTVHGLAFSGDGALLSSGNWGDTVGILRVATGQPEPPLTGIKEGCSGVVFSPDDKTLAVACEDGNVRLWNLATRREVAVLRHGKRPLRFVEFSPDGQILVSVSEDESTMRFWDAPHADLPE